MREDSQRQESEEEQQHLLEEIFEMLDRGERLTSGYMAFLRWYCGIPTVQPKDYAQEEMPLGWNG